MLSRPGAINTHKQTLIPPGPHARSQIPINAPTPPCFNHKVGARLRVCLCACPVCVCLYARVSVCILMITTLLNTHFHPWQNTPNNNYICQISVNGNKLSPTHIPLNSMSKAQTPQHITICQARPSDSLKFTYL